MYRAIWDSEYEPVIVDYKTSMPETLVTGEELERLKAANRSAATRQRVKNCEWVQEQLDLGAIKYKIPD